MGELVWLASYPKSGNTWLRALLTNYHRNATTPASLNELEGGPIASARQLFDEWCGVEASDLTPDEIARCRYEVYRCVAEHTVGHRLIKVHDAYRVVDGHPMFPPDVTAATVYILRNPLDVAVSFAHYLDWTIDLTVDRMCDGWTLGASGEQLKTHLEQILLPWSDHVRSWVDEAGTGVHIVRYEDLVHAPHRTFAKTLSAIGEEVDLARLSRAVAFSRFDLLQRLESQDGFAERAIEATAFFRSGQPGCYQSFMSVDQRERMIVAHRDVMRRFGYLDDRDRPLE